MFQGKARLRDFLDVNEDSPLDIVNCIPKTRYPNKRVYPEPHCCMIYFV